MFFWYLFIVIQHCSSESITASKGSNPACLRNEPCFIHCTGTNCQNSRIMCPLNKDCYVTCYDDNSCAGATVTCPDLGAKCDVSCQDSYSCSAAKLSCAYNEQCNIELHCNPGNDRGFNQHTITGACANLQVSWADQGTTPKNAYECIGGELNDKNACPSVGSPPGKVAPDICITNYDCTNNHHLVQYCSSGGCFCVKSGKRKGQCCKRTYYSGGSYINCWKNDPQYAYTIEETEQDAVESGNKATGVIIGVSIGAAILIAILVGICVYCRRKKKNEMRGLEIESEDEEIEEIVMEDMEADVDGEETTMTN